MSENDKGSDNAPASEQAAPAKAPAAKAAKKVAPKRQGRAGLKRLK